MQTITVRRTIKAPIKDVFDWIIDGENYTRVPTVLSGKVLRPGTGGRNGVGAIREVIAPYALIRERITHHDRPHEFRYLVFRSIPPLDHEGGVVRLRQTAEGTEVTWTSTFAVAVPIGSAVLTRLAARGLAAGFHLVLRTADRELAQAAMS